jgi:hypothetical protein
MFFHTGQLYLYYENFSIKNEKGGKPPLFRKVKSDLTYFFAGAAAAGAAAGFLAFLAFFAFLFAATSC